MVISELEKRLKAHREMFGDQTVEFGVPSIDDTRIFKACIISTLPEDVCIILLSVR